MDWKAHPIYQQRHMRIACIGAGLSGLCLAYKLQRSFSDFSLTIYEKNEDVGGVWFENRYPGLTCDFPAHNYTYSFEPSAKFPSEYADAKHIRQYFVDFAEKYGLRKYIKFQHEIIRAQWNEEYSVWLLQVKDRETESEIQSTCDILINAGGVLNKLNWPAIPSLHSFEGTLTHSAKWEEGLDLSGKRVGIIGNGASGQQLVASIQPLASRLIHFVRQPNWIVGPFGGPGSDRDYTVEEMEKFAHEKGYLLQKRKEFENVVNTYYSNYLRASPGQAAIRAFLAEDMKKKLGPAGLDGLLIPKYSVGCRRPTPGIGYLEALTADNTLVVFGDIKGVEGNGVVDQKGKRHCVDILVCATGFDASYVPRFPLLGEKNRNLQDLWADPHQTKAYLATAIPNFPNYFTFFGPGNPFSGGSYIWTIECQADYMLKFCDRWQTENIKFFVPKQEVVDELYEYTTEMLQKTVWTDGCRSWYKKGSKDSESLTVWPGSGLHFMEALSEIRADDWSIKYRGNRWSWLGNGFSQIELDPQADNSFYLREYDDSPFLSRQKRRQVGPGKLTKESSKALEAKVIVEGGKVIYFKFLWDLTVRKLYALIDYLFSLFC